VEYIRDLSKKGLAPTRTIIANFASKVAKQEISDAWVTRFLAQNNKNLISKWTSGINQLRHQANSWYKYFKYFKLLHAKIVQYKILPRNLYNIDKKGFLVSVTGRSKRVFSKGQ
jgi:uncharacterized protein YfbU (UPF0304 family)